MREHPDVDRFEAGLKTRRRVLGSDHVDASLAAADDFMLTLQKIVTEGSWNDTWNREGLSPKERSMICLVLWSRSTGPRSSGSTSWAL